LSTVTTTTTITNTTTITTPTTASTSTLHYTTTANHNCACNYRCQNIALQVQLGHAHVAVGDEETRFRSISESIRSAIHASQQRTSPTFAYPWNFQHSLVRYHG
jgi:hypothetical protein